MLAPMRWLLLCLLFFLGCSPGAPAPSPPPPPPPPAETPAAPAFQAPVWSYRVVNRFPHDPEAYTQGLLMGPKGTFYEGTGRNGQSELRQVEIATGRVLRSHKLAQDYFGEGIALCRGRLFQLTWQSQRGFIYDPASFKPAGEFAYFGEGWGLTTTPDNVMVMSNGSPDLTWRDPKTFAEKSRVVVKDGLTPVAQLNELEWVEGKIYANIFMTPYVAVVAPKDGRVEAFLDLRGLLSRAEAEKADVLNGIAYDEKTRKLYVTGKLWPRLFEIQVVKGP